MKAGALRLRRFSPGIPRFSAGQTRVLTASVSLRRVPCSSPYPGVCNPAPPSRPDHHCRGNTFAILRGAFTNSSGRRSSPNRRPCFADTCSNRDRDPHGSTGAHQGYCRACANLVAHRRSHRCSHRTLPAGIRPRGGSYRTRKQCRRLRTDRYGCGSPRFRTTNRSGLRGRVPVQCLSQPG